MTHEEMNDVIQKYCGSSEEINFDCCESCIINDLCRNILGDFRNYEKICEEAYKRIVNQAETQNDFVNHPSHYETGKFECIDVMCEAIGMESVKGFCLCNAFKYIYRCTKKHETPVEDVKKAVWYLNKFLELEGETDD